MVHPSSACLDAAGLNSELRCTNMNKVLEEQVRSLASYRLCAVCAWVQKDASYIRPGQPRGTLTPTLPFGQRIYGYSCRFTSICVSLPSNILLPRPYIWNERGPHHSPFSASLKPGQHQRSFLCANSPCKHAPAVLARRQCAVLPSSFNAAPYSLTDVYQT